MSNKSRRNRLNKKKGSRNQRQNKRSRRFNLRAGGDSVSMLYVKGRENPDVFELICVADNLNDLKLQARDVSPNMVSPFKNVVNDNMYIQITNLGKTNTSIRKLDLSNFKAEKYQRISSTDESTLYYSIDSIGLVKEISNKNSDIHGDHILSIRKNNFDWKHPLFDY